MANKRSQICQILISVLLFAGTFQAHARARETVLFLGSSTIANWGSLQKDFPFAQTVNRGIGGTTYADLYQFCVPSLQKYRPEKIVLYSGDNDLAAGRTPEQVAHDFARSIDRIHRLAPSAQIFVINIKPSPGRWDLENQMRATNTLIRRIARRTPKVTYVDVHSRMLDDDGHVRVSLFDPDDWMHIHFKQSGYDFWTSILRPYLVDAPAASLIGGGRCEGLLSRGSPFVR